MGENVWLETVQPDDIDSFGHVGTNRIQSWVLNGLVDTFWDRAAGGPPPLWFAASTQLTMKMPVGFIAEAVQIRSTVSDMRRRSAEVTAEVRTSEGLHATSRTVMVAVGADGLARPVREAEWERLRCFVGGGPAEEGAQAPDPVRLDRRQAKELAELLRDIGELLDGRTGLGVLAARNSLESSREGGAAAVRTHADALDRALRT
ncbi:hypothetical protein [Streptomyces sp. TBY4]|uniref:hypothetical protein n=1 Tax=Streptomyces sp. TBY4 TaxID=2962030 RepID=UPI0020B8B538|nr:hypothetical protein [Streptomyces sp. TBY4]MCP3757258.1 hypothetical protein [Streptomyces sp. TBY4]